MNLLSSSAFLLAFTLFLGLGVPGSQGGMPTIKDAPTDESGPGVDTVLAEGLFQGKEGIETAGSYRIERTETDLKLVLGKDFQTESGPDLFVVLSPKSPGEAAGKNVMKGAALKVDSLRSLEGKQTYDLRDNLDLEPFGSVVIQCIKFSHLYGAAEVD